MGAVISPPSVLNMYREPRLIHVLVTEIDYAEEHKLQNAGPRGIHQHLCMGHTRTRTTLGT